MEGEIKLKIAIYSHNPQTVSEVLDYTARYVVEKGIECDTKGFDTGETLSERQHEFDAVIIDIDGDGVSVATQMREKSFSGPIVFVTPASHFSIEEKTIDAMDLLVYPFSYFAFATMMDRVQIRLVSTETPTVAFMTRQGARRVSVNEITYIEGAGLHTICHRTEEDIVINGSLSDAEKKLTADRFFRLGKYLLNLGHVYKVSGNDVYVGTACLPLPPQKKGELLDSLLAFMNRG